MANENNDDVPISTAPISARPAPAQPVASFESRIMMMKNLTEGRNVHYVDHKGAHRAAMVTGIRDKARGLVDLYIFTNQQDALGRGITHHMSGIDYDAETKKPNTWHWLELELPA
jgi:hypothetical protein